MLNECLVFTSCGVVNRSSLTINHNTLSTSTEYIKLKSISYPKHKHTIEIQDSIDDTIFYLEDTESLLVYRDNILQYVKSIDLEVDDWIFHPWVKKPDTKSVIKLDLSLSSDNLKDRDSIYVFNHELLEVAKKFNISSHALKDILTRESADYEEYIQPVKEYIEKHYCDFKDISKYASKHFCYKMPRFIDTNTESFITLLAALTYYTEERYTLNTEDIASYILTISIPIEEKNKFFNTLNSFFKKLNVKMDKKETKTHIIYTIFNKPFFELYSKYLKYSLHYLSYQEDYLQELFLSLTPKNITSKLSLRLAISLKEFFYYHKRIYALTSEPEVTLKEVKDDLDLLESNLIVEDLGYFTKIISLYTDVKIVTSQITQNMVSFSGVIKLA